MQIYHAHLLRMTSFKMKWLRSKVKVLLMEAGQKSNVKYVGVTKKQLEILYSTHANVLEVFDLSTFNA